MQSLYLFPLTPARLRLDGPSLVVAEPGKAPQRFPLRRVSHIVLGALINVDVGTLAACLRRRISLTLLSDAEVTGIALPTVLVSMPARERIERFLCLANWESYYVDWKRASSRTRLLRAMRELAWTPPPIDLSASSVANQWERRLLHLGLTPDEVKRWIAKDHALLVARCALFLSRNLADPTLLASGPLLPPRDWIEILGWQSYADLENLVRDGSLRLADLRRDWQRAVTDFAESRGMRDDQRIAATWAEFLGFISLRVCDQRMTGRGK